jgi:hypothetical protein
MCKNTIPGKGLLEAADCLEEAPIGTVVVSKGCWPSIKDTFNMKVTPMGNYMVLNELVAQDSSQDGGAPKIVTPSAKAPSNVWTTLRLFCHEGARDLQDLAPFAAQVGVHFGMQI